MVGTLHPGGRAKIGFQLCGIRVGDNPIHKSPIAPNLKTIGCDMYTARKATAARAILQQ